MGRGSLRCSSRWNRRPGGRCVSVSEMCLGCFSNSNPGNKTRSQRATKKVLRQSKEGKSETWSERERVLEERCTTEIRGRIGRVLGGGRWRPPRLVGRPSRVSRRRTVVGRVVPWRPKLDRAAGGLWLKNEKCGDVGKFTRPSCGGSVERERGGKPSARKQVKNKKKAYFREQSALADSAHQQPASHPPPPILSRAPSPLGTPLLPAVKLFTLPKDQRIYKAI